MTHTDQAPAQPTTTDSDKNQLVAALVAISFLVLGVIFAYLALHTVFQIIFHSVKLMVETWLACSLVLGVPVVWGARKRPHGLRDLGFRDYLSMVFAPIGVFVFIYKGAKKVNHRRDRQNINA